MRKSWNLVKMQTFKPASRSKLWLVLFVFFPLTGLAQNEVLFSQYFLQPSFFNPAWNGFQNTAYFSTTIRSQWTGYTATFDGNGGAPNSQFLSFSVPVVGTFLSNIGVNVINDNLGPLNQFNLSFPVSFTLPIRTGVLSFSAMPGVVSQTFKFDELRFVDPTDPYNTGNRETQTRANISAGLMYRFFSGSMIGLSATNINQPTFDYGLDSLQSRHLLTYHLMGSYEKSIGRDYKLISGMIFKSDLLTYSFDLNTIVSYKDKAWGGVSYRRNEAIILLIGYAFLPEQRLKVGYSMDYVINERRAKQLTSQEIFLSYNLPELMIGGRKQVKTPRFTY